MKTKKIQTQKEETKYGFFQATKSTMSKEMSKKLNFFGQLATFSIIAMMRYPLPWKFFDMPKIFQKIWLAFSYFVEFNMLWMVYSNAVILAAEYRRPQVMAECGGTLSFAFVGAGKVVYLYTKKKTLERLWSDLHEIGNDFINNPLKNSGYVDLHLRRLRPFKIYTLCYYWGLYISYCYLPIQYFMGLFAENDEDRILPMAGYFPVDTHILSNYWWVYPYQIIGYIAVEYRDITIDSLVILTLSTFEAQFIFLGDMLEQIVVTPESELKQASGMSRQQLLGWWVKKHQTLLKLVDEFRAFAAPMILPTYARAVWIFLLEIKRQTDEEEDEGDRFIRVIIFAITGLVFFNIFQMSSIGDRLYDSSEQVNKTIRNTELFDCPKDVKETLYFITVRCTKPVEIKFGLGNTMNRNSYGSAMTAIFGYFNTFYQLRAGK